MERMALFGHRTFQCLLCYMLYLDMLDTLGPHFFHINTASITMRTVRRMTTREPTMIPPISPPLLADEFSLSFVPLLSSCLLVVAIGFSSLVVDGMSGFPSVVRMTGGEIIGQSADLRVSREVLQEASR